MPADICTCSHNDANAPVGVGHSHMHPRNGWMLSYRVMPMWMSGDLTGTDRLTDGEVHDQYMVVPQKMGMQMHMIGAMYAPHDRINLMAMLPFLHSNMTLATRMGMGFETESGGLGDISLGILIGLLKRGSHSLHAGLALSMPTGSIDQRDDTPMADDIRLGYPMQLGSGTWDPSPSITYNGHADRYGWGAQASYKPRFGHNAQGYRLGNEFSTTAWSVFKVMEMLHVSLRLNYSHERSIDGADDEMDPMMMPLFDAANSGRHQLDLLGGVSLHVTRGPLNGLLLAVEAGYPVYQQVTGIQMRQTALFSAGIQYSLGKHCSGCR